VIWDSTTKSVPITGLITGLARHYSTSFTADIFPNPVKDLLNIEITGNPCLAGSIYDVTGKEIKRFSTGAHTQLNVGDLNAGIYILQLSLENSLLLTKKIVVTK
jgi:hypothetical protein